MKKIFYGIFIILTLVFIGVFINFVSKKEIISENEVIEIILDDVKRNKEEFYFSHLELTNQDKKQIYNVDFNDEEYTYFYQINATNGHIINKNKEKITNEIYYIDENEIIDIAMKHANIEKEKAVIISNDLIMDDIPYYETIFNYNDVRYEYKINAFIGEIISVAKINEKNTQK